MDEGGTKFPPAMIFVRFTAHLLAIRAIDRRQHPPLPECHPKSSMHLSPMDEFRGFPLICSNTRLPPSLHSTTSKRFGSA
jgi:hypothetical protein